MKPTYRFYGLVVGLLHKRIAFWKMFYKLCFYYQGEILGLVISQSNKTNMHKCGIQKKFKRMRTMNFTRRLLMSSWNYLHIFTSPSSTSCLFSKLFKYDGGEERCFLKTH